MDAVQRCRVRRYARTALAAAAGGGQGGVTRPAEMAATPRDVLRRYFGMTDQSESSSGQLVVATTSAPGQGLEPSVECLASTWFVRTLPRGLAVRTSPS